MADLEVYRGDYIAYRGVAILADDEDVFDLTGSKIYFTAKSALSDHDAAALITLDSDDANITFPDPETGVFFVELFPADTEDIILTDTPRVLVYDVQVKTDDSPARVYTMDIGTLTIKPEVTRRSD